MDVKGRERESEKRRAGGQAGGSRNRRVTLGQETQRVDRVEGKGTRGPEKNSAGIDASLRLRKRG